MEWRPGFMRLRWTAWLLAAAALSAGPAWAWGPLPAAAREALARAEVPEEALTGIVMPVDGWRWGRTWAREADRPVQPGSTMKLLTSAVALDRLGPNLRGRTQLLSAAPQVGDVLQGDLVLRGGADPELGWAQLWQMLLELREQGVRRIDGDLVLDRSLFRPARIDRDLPPFDDTPHLAYQVVPDALMLTGQLMGVEITAGADTVQARTVPHIDGVELLASFEPADRPCAQWSRDWNPVQLTDDGTRVQIRLGGRFPRDCRIRTALQLVDRDRLAELSLRTLWTQLGGTLGGRVREGVAPPGARLWAEHVARPWGEVLRTMNKQSDNALSRLLFLQLGVVDASGEQVGEQVRQGASDPPLSTTERAQRTVRGWLAERQIGDRALVLDNGSGLSRSERLTPRLLAQVIAAALAGRHAPDWLMSLPTVGVDGTMRNRLKDSPAAGWARLKTGTLRDVAGLAGVVRDTAGRSWIVVTLINHDRAAQARPALDALVDWVARGMPAPQPTDAP